MSAAVNASRSGDLLNDLYELCELVESRDTHQLYSARDTRNDRLVHVSLLRPEVALRAGVAQRFVKVPKALVQLDHPNVLRVWSVESDATGIPFVVEEPPSGQPLAAMIESFPDGMPLGVAVNLLVPIVEAVAAAHGSGLAHGALDAKHVLLVEQAGTTVPKVFGFGDKSIDPREDVRALGALLFRALSGQPAEDKRRIALDELAPHLPLELTELVERCLASADERPADARLLSDELSHLRQRIGGGQRASAVSTERVVQRDSPAPTKPAAKPVAKVAEKVAEKVVEERVRRQAIERAVTAPVEPPPAPPVEVKIDPHGATFVDAEPPQHERVSTEIPVKAAPVAQPAAAAGDRDSIEFPMASFRPKPRPSSPDEIETKADEPEATREDRGKAKARKPAAKAAAKPNEPGIAVAGPARLAAAFAPLEGASNIEQGETREAELGRAFRQQQDDERQAREARFGRIAPMSAGTPADHSKPSAQAAKPQLFGAKPGADNKKKDAARPTAAEVIALSQLHAQEEAKKERRSRFVGALFLFLFCFFLARAVPLLNGPRAQIEAVLGTHVKAGAMAFAALSLVVLIRTWALQIQTKSMLLKPVTYTLKVVVICATILCVGLLMPQGSLGMVEGAARRFLPWASAGYFMFLGFYGIMRGMRETQANMIAGIMMALAYGGSFIGSYSIASNVIAPNLRAGRAQTEMAMQVLEQAQSGEAVDHEAVLENAGLDDEVTAQIVDKATAEDGFKEAKMIGGNEEEDMKSIREMGDARKRNGQRLDELKDQLPELAK